MTVKPVLKQEMGHDVPSNNAPAPPAKPEVEMIPDHTHPEYDQMMVKLQEIETELQGVKVGGVNQEGLEEGEPEHSKGKPKGGQEPLKDTQGNFEPKKVEAIVRKVIEELKGVPERDIGKQLDNAGPENTDNVPQSTQPVVGESPSGGGFDSDDKTNKEDGDAADVKVKKPASEYDKIPIKKNKIDLARAHIEKAKALMNEANDPDPTAPNPGAEEKEPKKQDGTVPNKSPTGGTEAIDGASEDPEANVPNDKRPALKEQDEDEDEAAKKKKEKEGEDEVEDGDKVVEKVFAGLKEELRIESGRQSMVGLTSKSNEQTQAAQEEFLTHKENVTKTIKEYLVKAGHARTLGLMQPVIG